MLDWIDDQQRLLWMLGIASVFIFFASLLTMPWLVARIPSDYFVHDERPPSILAHRNTSLRLTLWVAKHIFGVLLMLAGIAMLVLPGQGLLTILIGFLLIDFPRKYRFEKWLVARPFILRSINWLRTRADRVPLQVS